MCVVMSPCGVFVLLVAAAAAADERQQKPQRCDAGEHDDLNPVPLVGGHGAQIFDRFEPSEDGADACAKTDIPAPCLRVARGR